MGKKASAEKVIETEEVIIFKANKPLDNLQFELMSNMVKSENEKTGLKIVLMPYSCDLVEPIKTEETTVKESSKTADVNG